MELVYVTVIGAGIGLLLRYVLPGRKVYGVLLLPAVAAVATAATWVSLLWAGFTFDGGWIWLASLVAAAVASALVATVLSRRRLAADARAAHLLAAGRV